jgi:hypothetical protein
MASRVPAAAVACAVALGAVAAGWLASGAFRVAPLRAELTAARAQLSAHAAVAASTDQRYRTLEQEASHAQTVLLDQWRRERGRADANWLRLRAAAAGSSAVPPVPTERGSPDADSGHGLETVSGASGGALPGRPDNLAPALIQALETGERLEATLALCQSELQACARLAR